ncbi:MAG: hemerythrin domain-containing protein [Deltaproteobacteria bacterium]|nr:hemerythrin domain-containing protein [Deltaproteobacteria bacterium]
MNALMLLKTDHRTVAQLFDEILGTNAKSKKQSLIKKIVKELSVHAAVEEQVFYPAVRDAVDDAEDEVLEALEEHHIVKWVLSELEKMTPDDERFDAKVKVLCETVTHHVKEEETKLFKLVRKHMDHRALDELGRAMAAAKKVAPTHPHPRAPDAPPGSFVAGIGAGLIDRARDAVRGLAKAEPRPRRGASGRAKKIAAKPTARVSNHQR